MKRNRIIVMVVVLLLVLTCAFVGCNNEGFNKEKLFQLAQTVSNPTSCSYEVKQGNILIYSNVNGLIDHIDGIDFDIDSSVGSSGIECKQEYFSGEVYEQTEDIASYKATIVNTEAVLGIANASNATIEIVAMLGDSPYVKAIQITYSQQKTSGTFDVSIEVKF